MGGCGAWGKEPPSYSCGVLGQVCKSEESVYTAADTQCHPKADDKGHFCGKDTCLCKEKDLAVQEMRRITDELVEEFEEELRCKSPGRFQATENGLRKNWNRESLLTKRYYRNFQRGSLHFGL